jgi:hypothetical protein
MRRRYQIHPKKKKRMTKTIEPKTGSRRAVAKEMEVISSTG